MAAWRAISSYRRVEDLGLKAECEEWLTQVCCGKKEVRQICFVWVVGIDVVAVGCRPYHYIKLHV